MASMTHRTTVSTGAVDHLPQRDTSLATLKKYHQNGGLDPQRADQFLREWAEDRDDNHTGHQ